MKDKMKTKAAKTSKNTGMIIPVAGDKIGTSFQNSAGDLRKFGLEVEFAYRQHPRLGTIVRADFI
jgi:hypothetical protein